MATEKELHARLSVLGARAARVSGGYGRVPQWICAEHRFLQGANTNGDAVLNVPSEGDFEATKLWLLASARLVTVGSDPPVSEYTFRPMDWTFVPDVWTLSTIAGATLLVGAKVALIMDGRAYQTAPMNAAHLVSTREVITPMTAAGLALPAVPVSAYIGGFQFRHGLFLRAGSTLVVRLTPTYSPVPTTTTQYEFRITAVLSGDKIVRAA